jgi:beta-N-acetylhexosaminidase
MSTSARRRRTGRRTRRAFTAWLAVWSLLVAPMVVSAPRVVAASGPTLTELVGQKLVVAMAGTTPSASLLGRITRGEVGGVILFGANIVSAPQLVALTAKLRSAAAAGGQPPLLIAADQEGGTVKRVPWAPPTLTVPEMGDRESTSTASDEGRATGTILACAGINSALSPVADVPASTSSFMYRQGRTWSFDAGVTASLADAFASGLEAGLDVPTMKHFPGIGFATSNTDASVVTINATKAQLAPGLTPYQLAISHGLPVVMLSNATYPAYDAANAAGWSHAISVDLLRSTLGFTGVSMTDSLNGTAAARGVSVAFLATRAASAGTDMLLLTGSESQSAAVFSALVEAAGNGSIPTSALHDSYTRVLALKASLQAPPRDAAAPSTKAPVSRLTAGTRLEATTVPVRTTWTASDPCAISAYGLGRSTNGGAYAVQALASARATSISQSLVLGTAYRYRDRAVDGAGNTASWVAGSVVRPLVTQQYATSVTYSGAWRAVANVYASGGTLRYSTAAGASATYRFTAASVGWVAYRGPTRGSAAVYLDGERVATINLYSSIYQARPIVYVANFASSGSHTLRIVNLGTTGHSRVDVDAFVRLVRS